MAARTRLSVTAVTALVLAAGGVAAAVPALAAPGCEATYAVTGQWSDGFQGSLVVRNTGDPLFPPVVSLA